MQNTEHVRPMTTPAFRFLSSQSRGFLFTFVVIALFNLNTSAQQSCIGNNVIETKAPLCSGTIALLQGSVPTGGNGVYTYQWQINRDNNCGEMNFEDIPGATEPNYNVPSTVTQRTCFRRVVSSSGCRDDESNKINFNPQSTSSPVLVLATAVQPTCATATGSITVTQPIGAGLSYSINGTDYSNTTGSFTGLAAGTYQVTVRNSEGCTSAATAVVINAQPQPPAAPTATAVQPTCATATGSITVTQPIGAGLSYSINGTDYSNTTGSFTGLAAGTYQVTVRNSEGCTSAATAVVINAQPQPPAAPTATAVQPTCATATGSITVTQPIGAGLSYSINGTDYSNTTGSFTGLAAGTYQVTVRNSEGCTSAATAVVINAQPQPPAAPTATAVQPTCATATGSITVTQPLGAGLSYSINGTDYSNTTGSFTGLAAGTYQVTVRNSEGCTSAATAVVINAQPQPPAAPTATAVQPTCATATGSITVTQPIGAGLSYSINGTDYSNTTGSFTGLAAGTYQVTVRNSEGCTSAATAVVINAQPQPPAAPTATAVQPTCATATGSITVTQPIGAGLSYSINGTDYSNTTGSFTGLAAGTYQVTVRNSEGCTSAATAVVINAQPQPPAAPTATAVQPTCATATGSITVTQPLGAGLSYSINGTDYSNTTGSFTGLAAGTYQVTVRNSEGCTSAATAVVINAQPQPPAAPTATAVQPTCATATGSITVTQPIGAGLSYSINGTDYSNTTGSFTGLAAGTYQVTVRNSEGCTSAATAVVINAQPQPPAAPTATAVQPTCATVTGSITVTQPLGAGLSYSINGTDYSNTTGSFTGLAAGTYQVTARNSEGCTSAATAVVINAQPQPPAAPTATAVQPTCATATGSITVTQPIGAGLSYSINGTDYSNTTGSFTGLAAGTYQVTVRNSEGCTSAATAVVINAQPQPPAAPTATAVQPTCATVTGSITVTQPLGAGLSYSINGTDYSNTTGSFTGLAAGTYQVTVRNSEGCTSAATAVVINAQPQPPAAPTATAVQPTCATATGSITVTQPIGAGLSYSINGTDYSNTTGSFTGLAAGTYQVTVRNSEGCTSAATAVVINAQPQPPAAPTATAVQPTCATVTGSITVTQPLGAGLSYSINGTDYSNTTGSFTGLAAGTYQVTARNSEGCTSAATAVVINAQPQPPAAPTATAVQPTCATATGSITVTQPIGAGLSYSINGTDYSNTTGSFTGLAAGTYQVTVRNSEGCTSAATAVVINAQPQPPAAPTATAVQPTCATATGSITVTQPLGAGLSYSINGTDYSNTTGSFTGLAAGTYQVTVRNSEGCTSAATAVVINAQPQPPAAPTATAVQPTCATATGSITVTQPIGAGLSYSINGTDYSNTTGSFTGLAAGTYQVTVRNSEGCTSAATAVVINAQPQPPAAPTATAVQPTCATATGSITVTQPIGAGLSYSINGTDYSNTTGSFTGLAAGTYQVTVRNSEGCTSAATAVVINAQPQPPAAPTATAVQPTCATATGSITVTQPLGAGLSYSINGTDYSNTTGSFTGLAAGTYQVTVRNSEGCTSAATAVVINAQPQPPAAPTATAVQPTCATATGSITVTQPIGAGLSYSINGTDYSNTTGSFTGLAAGTYQVTVRNSEGCTSAATAVVINAQPQPPAAPTATAVQPTCATATGSITVTQPLGAGLSYSINGTDYSNTTGSFTGLAAGTYQVTVRNSGGCTSAATAVVINAAPNAPSGTISPANVSICSGSSQLLTVSGGTSYQWRRNGIEIGDATGASYLVTQAGTYSVIITNGACSGLSSNTVTVAVQDCIPVEESRVIVPTAFTPNRNSANDLLRPVMFNIKELVYFKVFNRWGQMVFETKEIGKGWDGTIKGVPQPTETYTWILQCIDVDGNIIKQSGRSLLIR